MPRVALQVLADHALHMGIAFVADPLGKAGDGRAAHPQRLGNFPGAQKGNLLGVVNKETGDLLVTPPETLQAGAEQIAGGGGLGLG